MSHDWRAFVAQQPAGTRVADLAAVVRQPLAVVAELLRRRRPGTQRPGSMRHFQDLFTAWHGRPPREGEWPAPRRIGGGYAWLPPELALLASLVGRVGPEQISRVLTRRLRRLTGDRQAMRDRNAVQLGLNRIGMQTCDVVGGLTVAAAARETGARSILDHEIRTGKLRVLRIGRYNVIPHAVFAAWKAARVFPPAGFVRLASLKRPLGIRSDKLSEWVRMGYVPTALRCNPYGTGERNTQFGTWWIAAVAARKLVADRRAGRPMPWWGKAEPGNLTITWRLWRRRQHPAACSTCHTIWGRAGAPTSWVDYVRRYPPLAHGAKRHLTWPWSPGLTAQQLAREAHVSDMTVHKAIRNGSLRARRGARGWRISRSDATRWKARRCPTGARASSWLAIPTACRWYHFTTAELERWIRSGRLLTRRGDVGPLRGVRCVSRQQVRELRDELGYQEGPAARLVGVSIARLRVLLRGLEWRPAPRIPAGVVSAAKHRQASSQGLTIAAAARQLRVSVAWIEREIRLGTVRVLRTRWNRRRRYISAPMLHRLERLRQKPSPLIRFSKDWLLVSHAGTLAGVSATTVQRWSETGLVKWRFHPTQRHRRYHRRSVMRQARRYWAHCRFKRRPLPAWLLEEAA